jgi:predicted component of type VI protein secretion system
MAGDLHHSSASGTTIIKLADGVLERGRLAGRVFPVVKARYSPRGPCLIGRTAENDIVIPEYSVSRRHCFIATVGDSHRVTDWGSSNGTLVNETDIGKMKPFPLQGGEILTLGRLMLLFLLPQQFAEYVQKVAPPADF